MNLKIFDPRRELLLNSRLLFTINDCEFCRLYHRFIQSVNAKLKPNKRITVINCSNYHDYNITDDRRIPIFIEYYKGSYPTLFINGGIIRGANSQAELEAWIKSRLEEDFEIPEDLGNTTFDSECRYVKKKWFGRILECQG